MSNKAKRLDRHETRIGRILRAEEFGVVVAIVGIVIVAMSLTPNFAVGTNINTILQQVSYVAICAAGMSLVIICGEIDLSIGSIYGLGAVMYTWLSIKMDWPIIPSIVVIILVSTPVVIIALLRFIFTLPDTSLLAKSLECLNKSVGVNFLSVIVPADGMLSKHILDVLLTEVNILS